jgi:hypothetical protein
MGHDTSFEKNSATNSDVCFEASPGEGSQEMTMGDAVAVCGIALSICLYRYIELRWGKK